MNVMPKVTMLLGHLTLWVLFFIVLILGSLLLIGIIQDLLVQKGKFIRRLFPFLLLKDNPSKKEEGELPESITVSSLREKEKVIFLDKESSLSKPYIEEGQVE